MQLQSPVSISRLSVERAVCAGVPGSLQKLSNTAAHLAMLSRCSWSREPGDSCPSHTSPTASPAQSRQLPNCSNPTGNHRQMPGDGRACVGLAVN